MADMRRLGSRSVGREMWCRPNSGRTAARPWLGFSPGHTVQTGAARSVLRSPCPREETVAVTPATASRAVDRLDILQTRGCCSSSTIDSDTRNNISISASEQPWRRVFRGLQNGLPSASSPTAAATFRWSWTKFQTACHRVKQVVEFLHF